MQSDIFKEVASQLLSTVKIRKNNDDSIDVDGELKVEFPFIYLPKIRILNGNFDCSFNKYITSLIGSPLLVGGHFRCNDCVLLTTLIGSPLIVDVDFWCHNCPSLISLEGSPFLVGGNFKCYNCVSLKSLKGGPLRIKEQIYHSKNLDISK